jgi:TolA-binding protein
MSQLLMESVPTDWSPWLIAGVGAAALALLMIVMRPARGAGAPDDSFTSDDDPDETRSDGKKPSAAQQRAMEREMSQLMSELSEMARQVTAQLDARLSKLERLMREADERIAKLQAMSAAIAQSAAAATSAGGRLESLETVEVGAPKAAATADAQATDAGSVGQHVSPQSAEIYSLADAGEGAAEIAARLGRPTGEVELILALRVKN